MANATEKDQRRVTVEEDGTVVDCETGEIVGEAERGSVPARTGTVPAAVRKASSVPMGEFLQRVATPESLEENRRLMAAYDEAVDALLGPNDVQEEEGRRFKKKSAWRKLARFFGIDTEVVSKSRRWEVDPEEGVKHCVAEVVVRATAPWGQTAEATGADSTRSAKYYRSGPFCPSCGGRLWDNRREASYDNDFRCGDCGLELREGDYDLDAIGLGERRPDWTARASADHDVLATAQTRATNRAISDLIAAGEVSAEEVEGGRAWGSPSGAATGDAGREVWTLDSPFPFGKHKGMPLREFLVEAASDYVDWVIEEANKTPDDLREFLLLQRRRQDVDARWRSMTEVLGISKEDVPAMVATRDDLPPKEDWEIEHYERFLDLLEAGEFVDWESDVSGEFPRSKSDYGDGGEPAEIRQARRSWLTYWDESGRPAGDRLAFEVEVAREIDREEIIDEEAGRIDHERTYVDDYLAFVDRLAEEEEGATS